jgi:hypothetical protein
MRIFSAIFQREVITARFGKLVSKKTGMGKPELLTHAVIRLLPFEIIIREPSAVIRKYHPGN